MDVVEFDLRSPESRDRADICDPEALARAIEGCTGVVHLAAVSRVVWGQRDPSACWSTNVEGTRAVVAAASSRHQWVLFASSREVYGAPTSLPATEDSPLAPVNIYGHSKVAAEKLVADAGRAGLPVAIVRLSNVYGRTTDHADRVVPAFARAAANGTPLRVEGASDRFDFTHLDDVVRGLVCEVERLGLGDAPPPLHFVSEQPTTLRELAELAVALAGTRASIVAGPERDYDVARFYGCGERARQHLGWSPRVALRDGLARLIRDFSGLANRDSEVAS